MIVVAVVITAFTLATAGAFIFTSTTSFCNLCHLHPADIAAYKQSAHRNVNCEQCHTKPGPFFFLSAKLEAMQEPVKFFAGGYEKPILGSVQNAACRRCHNDAKLFTTLSVNGINVNHQHLIQAGYLCIRCHATVAHGTAVPKGSQSEPTMDQCLVCHNNNYRAADGTVAVSRCDLCHKQPNYGAAPASHQQSDWKQVHGSQAILSTCSACHPQPGKDASAEKAALAAQGVKAGPDCVDCHNGVGMPHAADWLTQHGAAEQRLGLKACEQCHQSREYCTGCHKVKLPHPAGWFGQHQTAAAQSQGTCFTCHDQANCQACHAAHEAGSPQAHNFLENKVKPWQPTPGATLTASPSPTP